MWNCFENYQSPSKVSTRDRELGLEPGGLLLDLRASSKNLLGSNHGHRRSHGWRSHRCCFATSRMAQLGLWGRQPGKKKGCLGNWPLKETPEVSIRGHQ